MPKCTKCGKKEPAMRCICNDCLGRLAAYEDTGLEPEDIMELKQAAEFERKIKSDFGQAKLDKLILSLGTVLADMDGKEELRAYRALGTVEELAAFAVTGNRRRHRTMAEWISVKERLPKELFEVIIFTEATEQGVCMAYLENGKWLDGYSGRGITIMQQELVTHWMPLPEPPEEVTQ